MKKLKIIIIFLKKKMKAEKTKMGVSFLISLIILFNAIYIYEEVLKRIVKTAHLSST